MNELLQTLQPPNPPTTALTSPTVNSFSRVTGQLTQLSSWAQSFANWTVLRLGDIRTQVNTQVQGIGPPLPSAATITPTSAIHHVTGAAAIANITVPPGFSGNIWLIPDGTWTMVTGGTIAIGVTAVVNRVLEMTYDNIYAMLWFPSYLS
jgi:hypothetical protein